MEVIFGIQDIDEAANKIISLVKEHKTVALHGTMGAGKTTFVSAVCKALGVVNHIASPTFSIINHYKTDDGENVYHLDLYRLKDKEELIQTGVEDCIYASDICFIEWPELAAEILPPNTLHITLSEIDNNRRKLKINL